MSGSVKRPRLRATCAGLAALWAAVYLGLCLRVLPAEDHLAGWFVGLVVVAIALCVAGVVVSRPRPALLTGAGILGCCAVLGALSIGLGFVPAAVLALVAGLVDSRATPRG